MMIFHVKAQESDLFFDCKYKCFISGLLAGNLEAERDSDVKAFKDVQSPIQVQWSKKAAHVSQD